MIKLCDTWLYFCVVCPQEEQAAKVKAEKIRVALEKIKEAQVKKVKACRGRVSALHSLFIRTPSRGRGTESGSMQRLILVLEGGRAAEQTGVSM